MSMLYPIVLCCCQKCLDMKVRNGSANNDTCGSRRTYIVVTRLIRRIPRIVTRL